ATKSILELSCPAPLPTKDTILLGHGSGGKLSAELVRDVFLPTLSNPVLARLDDQAIVNVNGTRLAMTTDSFVVKPLFFPGGDIGSLAVHGTVNDLAMGGAKPLFLSAAFIIEEGFSVQDLRRVVVSMHQRACRWSPETQKLSREEKGTACSLIQPELGLCPRELNCRRTEQKLETKSCSVDLLEIMALLFWPSAKGWNSRQPLKATVRP